MKRWNVVAEYKNGKDISSQIIEIRGPDNFKESLELPTELKIQLKEAKKLVDETIKSDNSILIYGDYDADGISSTAILYKVLKDELQYKKTFYFIPNRFEHGYGLSKDAIHLLLDKNPLEKNSLIITVDTGITAKEEVSYLKSLGYKVLVIDHHQKPENLPEADCFVWYDKVVAAVLAWVFARILGSSDKQSVSLAALATITDLQQVLGFNRVIVKKGLEVFNSNPIIGIKELLNVSGRKEGEITTYDLGWVIGPRINASGRLIDAGESFLLLTEKDQFKVKSIAKKLNDLNIERQDKTEEMFALADVEQGKEIQKIIFTQSENYHEGIIGLVAAKLVQKFYRPSVVIALNDGVGKGSVRSIKGVDIIAFLRQFEDLFESLGGHPMAAGFNIKKDNISKLIKISEESAKEQIKDELLIPELNIDMKIPAEIINIELLNQIDKLKPFGLGNEDPVFLCENLSIAGIDSVGREAKHVRMKFYKDGNYYKGIYFNGSLFTKDLNFGDTVDLVFSLKKNEFNGNINIDLVVKDFKRL